MKKETTLGDLSDVGEEVDSVFISDPDGLHGSQESKSVDGQSHPKLGSAQLVISGRGKKMTRIDELGDDHAQTSKETPLRKDAFAISPEEKVSQIECRFREIMEILGLDLSDDSLSGTPKRVAKMYVHETFGGLLPENKPAVSLFDNAYEYNEMLVEKDVEVYSTCEHHFVPIIGRAHVAYFSSGQVIGLSKINRIVQYYSKRPQVQERLNVQIVEELQKALNAKDVACVIEAKHLCVNSRGVRDTKSSTVTAIYRGKFHDHNIKSEFLKHISIDVDFNL